MSQAPENPPEKPPENKHSPRPWKAALNTRMEDANGHVVARVRIDHNGLEQAQANRDLILDAVNGQKELEDAAKGNYDAWGETSKALRKASNELTEVKAQRDTSEQKIQDAMESYDELTVLYNNMKLGYIKVMAQRDELVVVVEQAIKLRAKYSTQEHKEIRRMLREAIDKIKGGE